MIKLFPQTIEWLARELSSNGTPPSLFKQAMEKHDAKCAAQHLQTPDLSKHAAAYGGVFKTWQSQLIESITNDLIYQLRIDPSRLRIRAIQQEIFGRAQGSDDRKRYAVTIRNGGGRASPLPAISDEVKASALQMFLDHRDDLKQKVLKLSRKSTS